MERHVLSKGYNHLYCVYLFHARLSPIMKKLSFRSNKSVLIFGFKMVKLSIHVKRWSLMAVLFA